MLALIIIIAVLGVLFLGFGTVVHGLAWLIILGAVLVAVGVALDIGRRMVRGRSNRRLP